MTIKIPVSADFDGSKVEAQLQAFRQQLNALGSQIAQTNKVQFNPIGKTTLDDMRKVIGQFEALKRVSGDLNKRVNATGQKGAGFFDIDWAKLYPDQASRGRQMAKAFQYVTGSQFGRLEPSGGGGRQPPAAPPSTPPRGPSGGGGSGPTWTQTGGGVVQAGLRAAGPVGGVAAGALGTGMSAGVGAGLMGLLGGLGALGIGKIVGLATEKIGQAEDNLVQYDKLKRVLGDVNVGFKGLKTVLDGAAQGAGVTFAEVARLGSQFSKLGNLSGDKYGTLDSELRTGIGLSRSFGLDPSEGVGFLGTMRGMRQTQDEQGSRKMALLVGETIAKSGAFAKADEVIGAISGYVTSQTRASLGANASGFAGMFSSMVGSGIPGFDPAGAAGLLSRINSSLSSGGAKGEASQFFSAGVGRNMGLDPIQTQILREGGAFATNDNTFGKGSVASRFGIRGPAGSSTWMQGSIERLKAQYGSNPGLLAQATANHFGINMRQAMGVLSIDPSKMGELEGQLSKSGVELKDMNFAGLGSLAKVVSGSSSDRLGVASELWSRTGKDKLSDAESSKLDHVMKAGSAQEQKDVLAQLIASRDQEMTQGKDIRDTKTGVDNIKTLLAEQLLPVTQAMRDGIMYIAGGGKKSSRQIQLDLMGVEHRENTDGIIRNSEFGKLTDRREELKSRTDASEDAIRMTYRDKPEIMEAKLKARADNLAEMAEIDQKLIEAKKTQTDLIDKENKAYEERKAGLDKQPESFTPGNRATPEGWRAPGGGGVSDPATPLGEAPASVIDPDGKMTRGYRNNNPGNLEATIPWKGMTGSDGRFAKFGSPADGYRAIGSNVLAYKNKYGINTIRGIVSRWAPPSENNTAAYISQMTKELGVGPDDPLNVQDKETMTRLMRGISKHENGYQRHDDDTIRGAAGSLMRKEGTPLPEGGRSSDRSENKFILDATPIEIIHKNERGERVGPSSQLATRVRPASPFGADRSIA